MSDPCELWICVNWRPGSASPSCASNGAKKLADRLQRVIEDRGMAVDLVRSACHGRCSQGPSMRVLPDLEVFLGVTEDRLPVIVAALERRQPKEAVPPPC